MRGAFDYSSESKSQELALLPTVVSCVRGLRGEPDGVLSAAVSSYKIKADAIVLRDVKGKTIALYNSGFISNNLQIAGPNGRDSSTAWATNAIVYFYFIFNGSTLATLSSPIAPNAFTASRLPPGYTYWAFATAIHSGYNTLPGSVIDVRNKYARASKVFNRITLAQHFPTSTSTYVTTNYRQYVPELASCINCSLELNVLHNAANVNHYAEVQEGGLDYSPNSAGDFMITSQVANVSQRGSFNLMLMNLGTFSSRWWINLPSSLSPNSSHYLMMNYYEIPNGDV